MLVACFATCHVFFCLCRFPGSDFTWNAVNDVTDVDLLSDATVHLSTHKACENQAYNINNGDLFRWKELWPKIAHHFGMETGPNLHIELVSMMGTPDKKQLWDKIVKVQFVVKYVTCCPCHSTCLP
jgi:nucleoside-diphosphate-sugar epimerase